MRPHLNKSACPSVCSLVLWSVMLSWKSLFVDSEIRSEEEGTRSNKQGAPRKERGGESDKEGGATRKVRWGKTDEEGAMRKERWGSDVEVAVTRKMNKYQQIEKKMKENWKNRWRTHRCPRGLAISDHCTSGTGPFLIIMGFYEPRPTK